MPGPGSKKQSQRTKGNVKPSSSSQAAELLAASSGGSQPSGFIGFGGALGAAAYVPVSQVLEDEDSGLDPTFRLTLRKLSKRDSITKLKALQEFSSLCKDNDEEIVKAVLPFWPRIYNKISLDVDHKVREACQQAMSTLVSRVRRSLAPHLKTVMGCWLVCQCDTYPTVATAAQQAFTSAFPPAKQTDAIIFCKNEIAEFLSDNITNQTAESLSDPKTCTREDMDTKYNRVLTSSLLAWRKLLETVSKSESSTQSTGCHSSTHSRDSLSIALKQLLENSKLWKLSKSPIISVKAALYTFISGVCQTRAEVAMKFSSKICPLILHNIDEVDAVICSPLWEAVLSVITYSEDCWSHINAQKAFLPKLRKLLENGCNGNAVAIGPNLLPLLSKIPEDICDSKNKLLEDFFQNLKLGLTKASVENSPSETGALVQAFMECAQYSIKQCLPHEDEKGIVRFLLLDQISSLAEASLVDKNVSLSRSPLYGMLGNLLQSLSQSDYQDHEAVVSFREHLEGVLMENVERLPEAELCNKVKGRLTALVKALIDPELFTQAGRRQKTEKAVKFAEDETNMISKPVDSTPQNVTLNDEIRQIVDKVCLRSFVLAKEQQNSACLDLFTAIVTTFPDPALLKAVLTECIFNTEMGGSMLLSDNTDALTEPVVSFIHLLCLPWIADLQQLNGEDMSDDISCLLDMIFVLLEAQVHSDVIHVLSRIEKTLSETKLFQLFLEKCLEWMKRVEAITDWFRGYELGERLMTLTRSVCQTSLVTMETGREEVAHQWKLLSSVLSSMDDQEQMLNGDIVERILGTMQETLILLEQSPSGNRLDTAVLFVSDVMEKFFCSLKGCLLVPAAERLLLTLFMMSLEETLTISEMSQSKLIHSWRSGLKVLLHQGGGLMLETSFLTRSCQAVRDKVFTSVHNLSSLNTVCEAVHVLLSTVIESLSECNHRDPTIQILIDVMTALLTHPNLPQQITQYLFAEDNLTSIDLLQKPCLPSMPSGHTLSQVIYPALFSVRLLTFSCTGQLSAIYKKADEEAQQSDDVEGSPSSFSWEEKDYVKLHMIIFSLGLAEIWVDADRKVSLGDKDGLSQLLATVQTLMTTTDIKDRKALTRVALEKSEDCGSLWARCLQRLISLIMAVDSQAQFSPPDIVDRYVILTEANVQTLQLTAQYLPPSDLEQLAEVIVARIISMSVENATDISGVTGALAVANAVFSSLLTDPNNMVGQELMVPIIEQMNLWRKESNVTFSCDPSEGQTGIQAINLEMMKFLQLTVHAIPHVLTEASWDFVLCAMVGWVQSLDEITDKASFGNFSTLVMCIQCCHLVAKVAECISVKVLEEPTKYPANLRTEWEEFFSEGAFSILLSMFLRLCGEPTYQEPTGVRRVVLSVLGHAVSFCPKQQVVSHQLPVLLLAGQQTTLPDSLQTILNHFCPKLLSQDRTVQVTSYWIMDRVMADLPGFDKEEEVVAKVEEEDPARCPPASLMKVLSDASTHMEVILLDLPLEECFIVSPVTEEFHCILGYLLSWKLLLNFFRHVPSEIRPQYTTYLKETITVKILLDHIFCLMPDSPSLTTQRKTGSSGSLFDIPPTLSSLEGGFDRELQHVACSVYQSVLKTMPAMARQWWKDQDRKTAAYVYKFTTKYASPLLCTAEIQTVQTTNVQLDNITVKARPTTREVIATYSLEEVKTEMVISLPPNYPLGTISVTSEKRVGVSAAQWEKWLLQLNIFLQHQNGSIIEGLKMWKKNIDKRFEGVEECTICYSVIHANTFQLPKLQCRTCKKKFHSACLYKWFSTSHNSTCPLCRNLF